MRVNREHQEELIRISQLEVRIYQAMAELGASITDATLAFTTLQRRWATEELSKKYYPKEENNV